MILYELFNSEDNPHYRALETANGARLYDFLNSAITISLAVQRPFLSAALVKAFNAHAIALLHPNAGEYRRCLVKVSDHEPIDHWRVDAHMEDFINVVNFNWKEADPVVLAAFTLWRLNHIHPFINGNGRTSRAVCYFVLCVKAGGLLGGTTILPELLRREHGRYVLALQEVDNSLKAGTFDIGPVHKIVSELLEEQLKSSDPPANQIS